MCPTIWSLVFPYAPASLLLDLYVGDLLRFFFYWMLFWVWVCCCESPLICGQSWIWFDFSNCFGLILKHCIIFCRGARWVFAGVLQMNWPSKICLGWLVNQSVQVLWVSWWISPRNSYQLGQAPCAPRLKWTIWPGIMDSDLLRILYMIFSVWSTLQSLKLSMR